MMEIKSAVRVVCEVVKSFYPPRANGKTIIAESLNTIIKYVNEKEESADKYKWHDLRKNPDDLPEKFKDVYVCVLNRGKKTYNRTWLDDYAWRNATSKRATHYQKGSVIAWREIEPYMGIEYD